jgi:hypothetical protein
MPRSIRSVTALLVVTLIAAMLAPVAAAATAAAGPQATQAAPRKDPHGDHGGGRPDPRCHSLERRVEVAKRDVDSARDALVAAKQTALRGASGRRAKRKAARALARAKAGKRAAQGKLGDAKTRLATAEHQAQDNGCSTR